MKLPPDAMKKIRVWIGEDPDVTELELTFEALARQAGLMPPASQYAYAEGRKFRADYAYPDQKLLVEIEGGLNAPVSGHNGRTGVEKDCERSRWAAANGWRVFRVTASSMKKKPIELMALLQQAIAEGNK